MKKLIIILLTLLTYTILKAGDPYTEIMQKNIMIVYTSKSTEEVQQAINTFDRVGAAEKTKWEPYYYAAFGYVMLANREGDVTKKDQWLDAATTVLEKGKAIVSTESELTAMEGFIHMIRVTVDPATRGQQYAGLAMQSFSKAIQQNPENPRALALLAQMQFGTAQFFGSPVTEACDTLTKAIEKFETYKSANPLAPVWGKEMTVRLQSQCR
jgi:tetratricopeptide (TPR) repeat protein